MYFLIAFYVAFQIQLFYFILKSIIQLTIRFFDQIRFRIHSFAEILIRFNWNLD